MRASELRGKTAEALQQDLLDLLREQFNLRMQKANNQLNQHTQLKQVRRDVARIKTVLHEKRRAG